MDRRSAHCGGSSSGGHCSLLLLSHSQMKACQIEFVSSDGDVGMACGKPAVAKCADCGASICSDCQLACCGDSFCGQCYDYHITNTCVRKPVQNVRPLQTFGSSQRSYGGLGSHGDFFVLVFFRLVQSVSLIFLCSTNESAFHWIVTFHDRSWAAKYTLNVRQYRCFDVKQYPMCGVVVRA